MEKELVLKTLKESIRVKERFLTKKNAALITEAAVTIVESFKAGGKLMLLGNGGSAADAQHMAAELVNRFEIERPPLPAVALTTDSSVLTSIGNDYDYGQIFSKQVKAIGVGGDVLLAISTSGNSTNVVKAVEAASKLGLKVIGLSGGDGGKLAKKTDILINVNATSTARIQEVHITVIHILCQLIDHILFQKVS
ncbi:MAG: D-sedoheptulose 7-phosphate isomerase [Deltaproteobacteria bacterium]|nr:D-sedoheptulose 7-phosphate isomerase [Deltaproteobacteria bacterium]